MTNSKSFRQFIKEQLDWDSIKTKYSKDENYNVHRIDVFNNTGALGYIEWDIDDGEIQKIFVGDKIRRLGLGTHIFELAQDYAEEHSLVEPEHSSRRSFEGDAWANAVGGRVPGLTDDIDGWSSR
jgi:GNAT superfamily N-acetyltransferase